MIPIRNIYYMLAYAFQELRKQSYRKVATEKFHNVADLCAAILASGIGVQLKRGLGRDYIGRTEPLSTLQGKLDISESIKMQTMLKKQMVCSYDEFSIDTEMNRIVKSTVQMLVKADIDKERKKELRNLMMFFEEVNEIDLRSVDWHRHYNRGNAAYQMLISICYLVFKGLLQSRHAGTVKLMDFLDEQRMCALYQKFLLEYYRQEHPELKANASRIPWQLDDGSDDGMLPRMQTDIMLMKGDKVLVIDAKYYSRTTQEQFGVHTQHSGNLYQIFTYVKNKEYELSDKPHVVSGMLLYAKTDEEIVPDHEYGMSGNRIAVRTLDLNVEFEKIRKQLDDIVGPASLLA